MRTRPFALQHDEVSCGFSSRSSLTAPQSPRLPRGMGFDAVLPSAAREGRPDKSKAASDEGAFLFIASQENVEGPGSAVAASGRGKGQDQPFER